jgi:hypothetical protein
VSARHVRVVLSYQGVDYAFDDPFPMGDEPEEGVADAVLYMYTEGNYACDCNRSLFLGRHCEEPPEFPPDEDDPNDDCLPCGKTIGLVSLVFVASDGAERVLFPESENSPGRIRERLAAVGMTGPW